MINGENILVYRDRGSSAPTLVEKGSPAPEGRANIAEEFLHHLETGEPLHVTLETPDESRDHGDSRRRDTVG